MKHRIAVIGSNSFSGADFIDLLLENPANQVLGISRSAEKDAIFLPYKRHAAAAYDFRKLDLNDDMPEMLSVLDTFKPEYVELQGYEAHPSIKAELTIAGGYNKEIHGPAT